MITVAPRNTFLPVPSTSIRVSSTLDSMLTSEAPDSIALAVAILVASSIANWRASSLSGKSNAS
jgi:hypothetical protein